MREAVIFMVVNKTWNSGANSFNVNVHLTDTVQCKYRPKHKNLLRHVHWASGIRYWK